jgi:hypothetical protein
MEMQFIKNLWKSFMKISKVGPEFQDSKNVYELDLVLSYKCKDGLKCHALEKDTLETHLQDRETILSEQVTILSEHVTILSDQVKEWRVMLEHPISSAKISTDPKTPEQSYHMQPAFDKNYSPYKIDTNDELVQPLFHQVKELRAILITPLTKIYNKSIVCASFSKISYKKISYKKIQLQSHILIKNLKPITHSAVQLLFPMTDRYLMIPRVKLKQ